MKQQNCRFIVSLYFAYYFLVLEYFFLVGSNYTQLRSRKGDILIGGKIYERDVITYKKRLFKKEWFMLLRR